MNSQLKRFLSLAVAFAMVLSYVPVNAFAAEEESIVEESVMEESIVEESGEEPIEEEIIEEEPVEEEPIEEEIIEEETTEEETTEEETTGEEVSEEASEGEVVTSYAQQTITTDAEVATLDMYLEKLLWPERVPSVYAGTSAGNRLSGFEKSLYDHLKTGILAITAGESRNTSFTIPAATLNEWGAAVDYTVNTAAENMDAEIDAKAKDFFAQFDINSVIRALVTDCPYELFWYGNAYNTGYNATQSGSTVTFDLVVGFWVSADMQDMSAGQDAMSVTVKEDVLKATAAAAAAKTNADQVVANNAHETDLEILKHYVRDICARVSYDDRELSPSYNSMMDNDAWAIVAVFDGDNTTNVVCEGYSKAFQYLCEKTTFSGNVTSYLATGDAGGDHMWNIVTIEGSSYLVDVTNCDEDKIGEAVNLFLAGGTANENGSYTFTDGNLNTITYTYDDVTNSLLGDVAKLAESDYITEGGDTELDGAVLTQEIIDALEPGEGLTITENTTVVGQPLVLPEDFTLTVTNGAVLDLQSGPAQIALVDRASIVFENGATFTRDTSSDPMVPFYVFVTNGATVTGSCVQKSDIWAQYTANSEAEIRTYLTEAAASGYCTPEVRTGADLEIILTDDLTIPAGVNLRPECVGTKLIIPEGKTLTVSEGAAMTLRLDGQVHNYGAIVNNGTITVTKNDSENCELYNIGGTITGNTVEYTNVVSQVGDDGPMFETLGAAVAYAQTNEEGPVYLLTDCEVTATIPVTSVMALFGKDAAGNDATHTITAAEAVDTVFQLGENGQMTMAGANVTTSGKYIFKLTTATSEILVNTCDLNGATEAAFYVDEGVDYVIRENVVDGQVYKSANVQIYHCNVSAGSVVIANGSNSQITVVGFGDETNPAKVLTASSAAGIYVLNGSGHTVLNQGTKLVNTAENGVAFTMTGDSAVLTADPWFNDIYYSPTDDPMPNNGAVARVDVWYYGSLQQAFDYAAAVTPSDEVGEDYRIQIELLQDITLTEDAALGSTVYPVELMGGHTITVGSEEKNVWLDLYTDVYLNDVKIIVKEHTAFDENDEPLDGGTVGVYAMLDIQNGILYVEDMSMALWLDAGTDIRGKVAEKGVPYHLAARWLDWDEGKLVENTERDLDYFPGVTAMDGGDMIFYLMIWDQENLEWSYQPVLPTNNGCAAYKISAAPSEEIAEGQANAGYFARLEAPGSLYGSSQTIAVEYGGGNHVFDFNIHDCQFGLFTTEEPDADTMITDGQFYLDADAEENVFYAVLVNPEEFDMVDFSWYAETWGEDYNSLVTDGEFLSMTRVSGKEGVFKFEVDPEFVELTTHVYKNANVRMNFAFRHTQDDWENWGDRDIWIQPAEHSGQDIRYIEMNGVEYELYPNGLVATHAEWTDEEGQMYHQWYKISLPTGVSYDYASNTLTLKDARLEYIQLRDQDQWEENGETVYRQRLPEGKLNLVVEGYNEIVCYHRSALELQNVDLNITGSGELQLNSINNPDNYNEDGKTYAFHTIRLSQSNLTIGGNAIVRVTVDGMGYWEDGNKAEVSGIRGDDGGNSLIIQDNAQVSVQQEWHLHERDDRDEEAGRYAGILDVDTVTVKGGKLDTTYIRLQNGTFNLEGGEVALHPRGRIGDRGEEGFALTYEGLEVSGGTVNVSGGKLIVGYHNVGVNFEDFGYVDLNGVGIYQGSTMNFTGGEIYMHTDFPSATAIHVDGIWDNDVPTAGSTLNISGDALLNVCGNREAGNEAYALWAKPMCVVNMSGGKIDGDTSEMWVHGALNMTGGLMNLYDGGKLELNGDATFSGGKVMLHNSPMYVNGNTNINGNALVNVVYDNTDMICSNGVVEVADGVTLTIGEGASFKAQTAGHLSGIYVTPTGKLIQTGGTVDIMAPDSTAIYSFGDVQLKGGIMNLNGANGLIATVLYECDDPDRDADLVSTFTMDGGEMNISAVNAGLTVDGQVSINAGATYVHAGNYAVRVVNNAHTCTADCGASSGTEHANCAFLTINGGAHKITGDNAGMALEGYVPVTIHDDVVISINAPYALATNADPATTDFALEANLVCTDTGGTPGYAVLEDADNALLNGWWCATEGEAVYADKLNMNDITTLKDWLETATPNENGIYYLTEDVSVFGSTTLVDSKGYGIQVLVENGSKITVKSGGTLIVPMGSCLSVNNGSEVIVEDGGTLYNYGEVVAQVGGSIAVDEVNGTYNHGDDAKLQKRYEVQSTETGLELVMAEISGIGNDKIELYGNDNEHIGATVLDQLKKLADDYAGDGYNRVELWTARDVDFTENYTLPATMFLSVDPPDVIASVSVAENVTLTVEAGASISLGTAALSVSGTLVNNGEIITDIHDNAQIFVTGTLTNNNRFTLNHANMVVSGTLENSKVSVIEINGCSTMTVAEGGTLNNYGQLAVGFWKPAADECGWMNVDPADFTGMAGTLNVAGTLNNYRNLETAPESDYFGGQVIVTGTLNNTVDHEEVQTGNGVQTIPVMGNINNNGQLVVEKDGEFNNSRTAAGEYPSVRNYGDLVIRGTLNNSAQFWNYDNDFGSGEVIAEAGAYVYNDGSMHNKSYDGKLDLGDAYVEGDSEYTELCQIYFEDGKLSNVNADTKYIDLIYEGGNFNAAANMYAYADRMGYKSGVAAVYGDMVIPEGEQLTISENQSMRVMAGSTVTVEGRLDNQGMLVVSREQTNWMDGVEYTEPAGELTVAQGGRVYNVGDVNVFGGLNNAGIIENDHGNIYVDSTYNPGEDAYVMNIWMNGWMGNISGIGRDQITLWTSIEDSEAELRQYMDLVNDEVSYAGGEVWIVGDLEITDEMDVAPNIHLSIINADGNEGHLTVADNGLVRVSGQIVVSEDATLTLNGTMEVGQEGGLTSCNGAVIEVNKELWNEGTVSTLYGSNIVNCGNIVNAGTFSNAGNYEGSSQANVIACYMSDEDGNLGVRAIAGVAKSEIQLFYDEGNEEGIFGIMSLLKNDNNPYGYKSGSVIAEGGIEIDKNMTLPENVEITVIDGVLTVNGSLTNNGKVNVSNNAIVVNGQIGENGTGVWDGGNWKLKNGTLSVKGEIGYVGWDALGGLVQRIELTGTTEYGSTMTTIPAGAFSGCNVAAVQIPASVTNVAAGAFNAETRLKIYHEQEENVKAGYTNYEVQHTLDENGQCTGCDYNLHSILNGETDIEGSDNIIEAVKCFDTEHLRDEMIKSEDQPDENGQTVMDKVADHEEEIQQKREEDTGSRLDVTASVENASPEIHEAFGDVHGGNIVGAVANAAEDASEVRLIISDPETISKEDMDPEEGDVSTAVLFSMTMEGVTDSAALDVPVKITLPIPRGIDPERLVVKHYHGDDEETLACFVSEDGNWVSFYMTRFSDVKIYNEPIPVTIRAKDAEMTYGGNLKLDYDLVSEETVTENFNVQMTVNGKVMTDLSKLDAGTYIIGAEYDAKDGYKVTVETGILTVAPKKATVAVVIDKVVVEVDCTELPQVTVTASVDAGNLIKGYIINDDENLALEDAVKTAGMYTIKPLYDEEQTQYNVTVVAATLTVKAKEYAAQIGEQMFETLQEAVNEAEDGAVIEMLKDDDAVGAYVLVQKNLTIKRNGFSANVAAMYGYTPIETDDEYIVIEASALQQNKGPVAAYIDAEGYGTSKMMTLQDALDTAATFASEENNVVVKLSKDFTGTNKVGAIIIPSHVVLNIDTYNLQADYIIALKNSKITNASSGTAGARLLVEKENLSLPEVPYYRTANDRYVLPVWDAVNENYVFGNFKINDTGNNRGIRYMDDGSVEFQFKHATNGTINDLFEDDLGADDNALTFEAIVSWTTDTGVAYEHFVYNADFVGKVAGKVPNKSYDFLFKLTNYEQLTDLKLYAIIVTDSGAQVTSSIFEIN